MEDTANNNFCILRGVLRDTPAFSHESRGERFYRFSLDVQRLSGAVDTLQIIAKKQLLEALEPEESGKICVTGELRSFNNKSGVGPRLLITVYAREIRFECGEDENSISLTGTLCKEPIYRVTPMGREICDLMLAVNRRYGRSDYLPCIAWGTSARDAARWSVGTAVQLCGRIQSRIYTKNEDGVTVEKTAYEVSVIRISEAGQD